MSKPDDAAKPATKPIGLRLKASESNRLDALVDAAGPGVTTRHALAKVALLFGLGILEKDFAKRYPKK
jgi:hypothetical protein